MEPDGELLRDRLGLRGDVVRFEEGSLPVLAIGDDLVLKLWPPEHHDEVPTEVAAMEALHGNLPVGVRADVTAARRGARSPGRRDQRAGRRDAQSAARD